MCLNLSEHCSSQILIVYSLFVSPFQSKVFISTGLSSSNLKNCSTSTLTWIFKKSHVQAYMPLFARKI